MGTIKLIAGLGNPGPEYEHTRHNAGVDLLSMIAERFGIQMRPASKFYGMTGQGRIKDQEVKLVFPTTYMNLSGQSVAAVANFYKIKPEEIMVIHDELDLEPGQLKLKLGGGHAGHNGLKSIISCLGNNAGFYRLRIGIGKPADRSQMIGYVLGRASPQDQVLIEDAQRHALSSVESIVTAGPQKAMNTINAFKANK
jgi:PTH1 family peptidyl-tRNA hydrolase